MLTENSLLAADEKSLSSKATNGFELIIALNEQELFAKELSIASAF